ncbi:unnamed protein product [Orchesella dallaii]|uniref:Uncharacterized protein n=1 Tax=Orchesella dallaii TaxID=48710 RepID=A0ABP1RA13_9HEXA
MVVRPVVFDDDDERLEFDEPQDIRNTYDSGQVPGLEWGYIGDLRRSSSVRNPPQQPASSHYKPRHFAGHGYGPGGPKGKGAPLASMEEMTPSLRSSFASVLMYPPSSWGGSDESLPSDYFANDFENGSLKKQGSFSALSVQSDFQ